MMSVKEEQAAEDCCVKVAVKVRPLVDIELAQQCGECLLVTPGQPQVSINGQTFTYDHVYGGMGEIPDLLYPECIQPLVAGLFKGYNATVLAYGQTGSGKTFTMGSHFSPGSPCNGVIPQVVDEMFSRMEHIADKEFTVRVSFIEIHQEQVKDLLVEHHKGPRPVVTIRELPSGVTLEGAVEKEVRSREEMMAVLEQGTLCRATASTNMNNRSSRSHAVFTIIFEQRTQMPASPMAHVPASTIDGEESEDQFTEDMDDYLIAKMHLVDLAGSERAKRTGAEGARFKEGISINQGLFALGKVISALVDNQKHVPYRDSKLTRLLQDSLGGNSRTAMIACISPADINLEETLNTLKYADRARHIKNKPVVNRDPVSAQIAHFRQQLAQLRAENQALKRALSVDGNVDWARAADQSLQNAFEEVQQEKKDIELEMTRLQMENDTVKNDLAEMSVKLHDAQAQRDDYARKLQEIASLPALANMPEVQELVSDTVGFTDVLKSLHERIAELEHEVKQLSMLNQSVCYIPRSNSSAPNMAELIATGDDCGASVTSVPSTPLPEGLDIRMSGSTFEEDPEFAAQATKHMMDMQRRHQEVAAMAQLLNQKHLELERMKKESHQLGMKQQYDKVLADLEKERDKLQKERSSLMQKLQYIQASSEAERRQLKATYEEQLHLKEEQLKSLKRKESELQNNIRLKARFEDLCRKLQADCQKIKEDKVAMIKRMNAETKRFNQWKAEHERENLRLKRQHQRDTAQIQHYEALQAKHKAVLKRKTEEAEAARKRIREMAERQQRARSDRSNMLANAEMQPNSDAPPLRSERERREWIEAELDICNQSGLFESILEGEIAQRSEAARQLREVQKRLMVLDEQKLPSPLMTGQGFPSRMQLEPREVLQDRKDALERQIAEYSTRIQDLQAKWQRAKNNEEMNACGAADIKRWNGIKTVIEAREMLRSVFKAACDHKAAAIAGSRDVVRLNEELDLTKLQLDAATQDAENARKQAAKIEQTSLAAMAASPHVNMGTAAHPIETIPEEDPEVTEFLTELKKANTPARSNAASPRGPAKALDFDDSNGAEVSPGTPTSIASSCMEDMEVDDMEEEDEEEDDDDEEDRSWSPNSRTPAARLKSQRSSIGNRNRTSMDSAGALRGAIFKQPKQSALAASLDKPISQQTLEAQHSREQRALWEQPVLAHVNEVLAIKGKARVNKLTVKLLKECLEGATMRGKSVATGCKTKDQLIKAFRIYLGLVGEESQPQPSINHITGSANFTRNSLAARGPARNMSISASMEVLRYDDNVVDLRKRSSTRSQEFDPALVAELAAAQQLSSHLAGSEDAAGLASEAEPMEESPMRQDYRTVLMTPTGAKLRGSMSMPGSTEQACRQQGQALRQQASAMELSGGSTPRGNVTPGRLAQESSRDRIAQLAMPKMAWPAAAGANMTTNRTASGSLSARDHRSSEQLGRSATVREQSQTARSAGIYKPAQASQAQQQQQQQQQQQPQQLQQQQSARRWV